MTNFFYLVVSRIFLLFWLLNLFLEAEYIPFLMTHSLIRIKNVQDYPGIYSGRELHSKFISEFRLNKEQQYGIKSDKNGTDVEEIPQDLNNTLSDYPMMDDEIIFPNEDYSIDENNTLVDSNITAMVSQEANLGTLGQEDSSESEILSHSVEDLRDKEKLRSRLKALLKEEKKLLRELDKIGFYISHYSRVFLSDFSMERTITNVKKYEYIKRLYEETRELIEKVEE